MKKITTVFYVFTVLALFLLLTGCGNSKKETETGETADNDAVDADIYDGDDAYSEPDDNDSDMDQDVDDSEDADLEDSEQDDNDSDMDQDVDDSEDADLEDSEQDDDDSDMDQDVNDGDDADSEDPEPDTERKEFPECSPTSGTPCLDPSSGLVWSSKSNGTMYAHDAAYYCLDLSEGGYSDWRLPSIDELRTLIENCRKTETGGTCRASEECRDSRCEDDYCAGCSSNSTGYYSKFGDSNILWSDSWPDDWTDCNWSVNFSDGSVHIDRSYEYYAARCVRDASSENSEDGENSASDKVCIKFDGKIWSNRVISIWSDAVDYCENLTECGISDWHLPTIDELRTLIRNNPLTESGGECSVTDDCLSYEDCYDRDICGSMVTTAKSDGRYNELGDINWFWSSSVPTDKPNSAWGVNFYYGKVGSYEKGHYTADGCNVRCVSKGKDKDPDGCASGEYQCLRSQSLRCKDGFWIPDEFCEEGCDSLTGKCR
jgi:hypothetical protein